ncbi:carbon-nitrogen hydrolase family protein [Salinibacillus xinjiangensis]|uniref:Carbon-nitrogen hydrolase family protein n=1 Tax=Salinibacillus xinjiangensis TaxID=1229268 RepID=A0A6G1X4K6_9BACI|nr:carbon-nitrogen hydrolase family protein [Salinibacillus xinjiangensis]MRG85894.1 carbon-nitrogen hydrolase family protein [Salinibacillus xinjiangensis]
MKIAGMQLAIENVHTKQTQIQHMQRIKKLAEQFYELQDGFDFLVLPELSTISYGDQSFQNLAELTNSNDSIVHQTFQELSQKLNCAICYGYPYEKDGSYYIRQTVLSHEGEELVHYDKIHIAQFEASSEKNYFSRGNSLTTFELNGWKFGMIICYDIRFPEMIRTLALKEKVDVIVHPVAFFKDQSFPSWHSFVVTRALENQVYFLSLNQAGKHFGNSIFCPPWVDFNQDPTIYGEDETLKTFTLEHSLIESVRKHYPLRDDKLAEYK